VSELAFSTAVTNAQSVRVCSSYANAVRYGDVPVVGGTTLVISRDEAYYWSAAWQDGERESLTAHGRGESVVFDSDDPNDITRWLLS
jgi:hypothetical protein